MIIVHHSKKTITKEKKSNSNKYSTFVKFFKDEGSEVNELKERSLKK